jgi:hypothetical protein
VQNNSFGRGLYAAQSGDPGVSEGASQTFPVIHTMRAAQAAVVELIERWARGREPVAVDEAPEGALCPERERGADQVEVKSGEVYGK